MGNMRGTAPGFALETRGTTTFVLPGPPHELRRMFERDVAPRLAAVVDRPPLRVETFRTFGIGESQLMERVGETLEGVVHFAVSSLPWISGVDIILTARPDADEGNLDAEAARVESVLTEALGTKLYEHGQRSLAEVTGARLAARGETVAAAESLTGGLIGTLFTDVPGSSRYVLADVVAYSNASKTAFTGVDDASIARDGAVSEAVCRQMAEGVRRRCGADWALSTTGIAGPTGGSPDKPVGLVYLGLAWDGGCEVKRRVFAGERGDVRMKSAAGAIWMLYDRLAGANDTEED
jgi:nicotinamide-nucleotide amidase